MPVRRVETTSTSDRVRVALLAMIRNPERFDIDELVTSWQGHTKRGLRTLILQQTMYERLFGKEEGVLSTAEEIFCCFECGPMLETVCNEPEYRTEIPPEVIQYILPRLQGFQDISSCTTAALACRQGWGINNDALDVCLDTIYSQGCRLIESNYGTAFDLESWTEDIAMTIIKNYLLFLREHEYDLNLIDDAPNRQQIVQRLPKTEERSGLLLHKAQEENGNRAIRRLLSLAPVDYKAVFNHAACKDGLLLLSVEKCLEDKANLKTVTINGIATHVLPELSTSPKSVQVARLQEFALQSIGAHWSAISYQPTAMNVIKHAVNNTRYVKEQEIRACVHQICTEVEKTKISDDSLKKIADYVEEFKGKQSAVGRAILYLFSTADIIVRASDATQLRSTLQKKKKFAIKSKCSFQSQIGLVMLSQCKGWDKKKLEVCEDETKTIHDRSVAYDGLASFHGLKNFCQVVEDYVKLIKPTRPVVAQNATNAGSGGASSSFNANSNSGLKLTGTGGQNNVNNDGVSATQGGSVGSNQAPRTPGQTKPKQTQASSTKKAAQSQKASAVKPPATGKAPVPTVLNRVQTINGVVKQQNSAGVAQQLKNLGVPAPKQAAVAQTKPQVKPSQPVPAANVTENPVVAPQVKNPVASKVVVNANGQAKSHGTAAPAQKTATSTVPVVAKAQDTQKVVNNPKRSSVPAVNVQKPAPTAAKTTVSNQKIQNQNANVTMSNQMRHPPVPKPQQVPVAQPNPKVIVKDVPTEAGLIMQMPVVVEETESSSVVVVESVDSEDNLEVDLNAGAYQGPLPLPTTMNPDQSQQVVSEAIDVSDVFTEESPVNPIEPVLPVILEGQIHGLESVEDPNYVEEVPDEEDCEEIVEDVDEEQGEVAVMIDPAYFKGTQGGQDTQMLAEDEDSLMQDTQMMAPMQNDTQFMQQIDAAGYVEDSQGANVVSNTQA